ncbi:5-formyltetrahydrofolate cyclo-ligase [Aphanothece hegewaldii CCALA 016]|uniref:5-formyltetrahydrofolate cyclo-ligase n=1 Tax=Aphanothece hegewaldii CCALA 016 TaxID=2107694 RepID=A0A2T1LU30_9CHRO|nr:5-formyltetrahydrofolate cyclo-ligase [Aphanothece hegewaldii]PSF34574.1 5-formyltetrahydrofolate cyclo-ligase [Aphanothece hegewaldii CCALA 016]
MSLQKSKIQLRKQILQERRSLNPTVWKEKSFQLCKNLETFSLFQSAKTILAYFSIRQEPDLSFLFNSSQKWGFPRCVGQSLVWHIWQRGEILETGVYGILEPQSKAVMIDAAEVDLILVPAVACDAKGYRLGYGGGYYDRMLSSPEWYSIPTVGIIFDFAYLPSLPKDNWDQPLNAICTETKLLMI